MILEEGQVMDQSKENKFHGTKMPSPPVGHGAGLFGADDAAAWMVWTSADAVEQRGCGGAASILWMLWSSVDAVEPAGTFPLPRRARPTGRLLLARLAAEGDARGGPEEAPAPGGRAALAPVSRE